MARSLMSDIQIVSQSAYRNEWRADGVVPYGTVFEDETDSADFDTFEGIQDNAVLAVDWRGIDQVDTVPGPVKRGPGRPRGSKSKKV